MTEPHAARHVPQDTVDIEPCGRSVIRLSPIAATAFDEALARPAQVNPRLRLALERPGAFSWID